MTINYNWRLGNIKVKNISEQKSGGGVTVYSGDLTVNNAFTIKGTMTFGDAVADSFIILGRVSTGTAAGTALDIDATTYQYTEGLELRYAVSDWADTYTLTSFRGMYLRAENTEANASGSIYGAEIYGVANNVNTQYVWGALIYAYSKGASARTITGMYAIQPEITFDAGSTTHTLTDVAVVRAKVTGGKMSDYTVLDGYRLTLGDMNGASPTYGNGLLFEDDSGMDGTCTLTTGININIGCTTGISLASTSMTTGIQVADGFTGLAIKVGSLSSTTPGTGCEISDTNSKAVDIHADDNNAAIDSAITAAAIRGRAMYYATVAGEAWGIHGLSKLGTVARTANTAAGVVGAFESTGTCSTATGSGNTYCAGVMGRVGTGGSFTIGAGTYVACVLAFGNNANSNAFTNTGYHAFHAALTDVGTPEVFDYGLFLEDSAMTYGIGIGNCTNAIDIGTLTGYVLTIDDDGTIAHDTDAHATGTCDISDFVGYLKVKVGDADRYIWLSDTTPSAGAVIG